MKIVLASGWPGPEAEPIIRNMHITEPLMSFYYAKKDLSLFSKYNKKLYLDSGVFTARKKGKEINIHELIAYTRKNIENIQYVFNLDTGDEDNQVNNCRILKDAGLPVIGIWHGKKYGKAHGIMELDAIQRFLEITDYLAIGAIKEEYFEIFFEYLYKKNLWPLKVHGLGIERPAILKNYPFYSADSSGFQKSYTFGLISHFNYNTIRAFHPTKNIERALKIDPMAQQMIGRTYEARDLRIANAILQREKLQKYLTDLWAKKGVTWENE